MQDPDEYKSHASDDDNATSGRSPSALQAKPEGSVAETPKQSQIDGKKSSMSTKNPKDEEKDDKAKDDKTKDDKGKDEQAKDDKQKD